MSKLRFHYNKSTCRYEPVKPSVGRTFKRVGVFLSVSVSVAAVILFVVLANYELPDEVALQSDNEKLAFEIELQKMKINEADQQLAALQTRDDEIYRIILEADSIPNYVRNLGIGGSPRFEEILSSYLPNKQAVIESLSQLNRLKRKLYLQSLSYDEIEGLVKEKEKYWASIPGIQPIANRDLRRLSTIFGPRLHPKLGIVRPHLGLDFMAPRNTPVYATGDGVVLTTRFSKSFGKVIEVDHGYGYVTRYAHLNEYNVTPGQKIKRGECLGFVGNTGLSVADHLHYEVLVNNVQVNPIYYFQRELSDEEYEELIVLSQRETIPLD